MTYERLIIVDYDPEVQNLIAIRSLSHQEVLEADLIVVLRNRVHYPSGLIIQGFVTEKDRYQSSKRKLSKEELISITNTASTVITVNSKGVVSEK